MPIRRKDTHAGIGGLLRTVVVIGAIATAVSACGGSTAKTAHPGPDVVAHSTNSTAAQSSAQARASGAQTRRVRPHRNHAQPARVTSSGGRHVPRPGSVRLGRRQQKAHTAPRAPDKQVPTGGHVVNPCRLVSLSEARSLTGGTVLGVTEAPLGPTCIYRVAGSKASITMTVESATVSQIEHQMKQRKTVFVSGRVAFCGTVGEEMLFVPVRPGEVLNVTAPCTVARQFATVAIGRLAA